MAVWFVPFVLSMDSNTCQFKSMMLYQFSHRVYYTNCASQNWQFQASALAIFLIVLTDKRKA